MHDRISDETVLTGLMKMTPWSPRVTFVIECQRFYDLFVDIGKKMKFNISRPNC